MYDVMDVAQLVYIEFDRHITRIVSGCSHDQLRYKILLYIVSDHERVQINATIARDEAECDNCSYCTRRGRVQ